MDNSSIVDAATEPRPSPPPGHLRAIIEKARRRARRRRVLWASSLGLPALAAALAFVLLTPEPTPHDTRALSETGAGLAAIPELSACPSPGPGASDRPNPSADGWRGKVAGVGCFAAGGLILDSFLPRFVEGPLAGSNFSSYATLERTAPRPGKFRAAGFTCTYGVYRGASGAWLIRCSTGDRLRRVNWTFSP